jgi:hypothetical protein
VAFGDRPDAAYAREEIDRAQALIGEFADQEKLFRPYGNYGLLGRHLFSRSALSYLREQGYTTISWTAVPGDWCRPDWDRDFETRFGDQDWPVVVLHDIENACLARLPNFIARLQDRGFDLRQGFPEKRRCDAKGAVCHLVRRSGRGWPADLMPRVPLHRVRDTNKRSSSSRSYSSAQLAITPATSAQNLQGRPSECVDNLSHLLGALSRRPPRSQANKCESWASSSGGRADVQLSPFIVRPYRSVFVPAAQAVAGRKGRRLSH